MSLLITYAVLRLSLQHNVLRKAFEGRIILPPVNLTHDDKVLDSGTGSGKGILFDGQVVY